MMQKFSSGLAGLLILIFLTHGCSGLQKEAVTKQYFDLSIEIPASVKSSICKGETLVVKTFAVSPTFDSHSFVYRIGENEYTPDYYSEFISYPSKLITEKISEALHGSTHFRPALTDEKKDITYRLSGKITRLTGDFTEKKNPRAVMEIMMILEKNTGPFFTPVLNNTYGINESIPDRKPSSLVSGWNKGLSEILLQFIAEFQTLPAS